MQLSPNASIDHIGDGTANARCRAAAETAGTVLHSPHTCTRMCRSQTGMREPRVATSLPRVLGGPWGDWRDTHKYRGLPSWNRLTGSMACVQGLDKFPHGRIAGRCAQQ